MAFTDYSMILLSGCIGSRVKSVHTNNVTKSTWIPNTYNRHYKSNIVVPIVVVWLMGRLVSIFALEYIFMYCSLSFVCLLYTHTHATTPSTCHHGYRTNSIQSFVHFYGEEYVHSTSSLIFECIQYIVGQFFMFCNLKLKIRKWYAFVKIQLT